MHSMGNYTPTATRVAAEGFARGNGAAPSTAAANGSNQS
jgi:hypothetical protein